jgi:prevent-host-death family protein
MTRKQRAAPQSAPPKGQTPPPTRQRLAKRDESTVAAKRSAAQESNAQTHPQLSPRATWRLEEAKARFREVVRRARDQGPQYVTVRGKQAVAIIDAAELERLLKASPGVVPLVQFQEGLHIESLDLTRDRDLGRDAPLELAGSSTPTL